MNEAPSTDVDRAALETVENVRHGADGSDVSRTGPTASLMPVLFAEAAAAFEELTLSGQDDQLKVQVPDAWPNLFRETRFLSAVDFVQADRLRRKFAMEMARIMFSGGSAARAIAARRDAHGHELHGSSVADAAGGVRAGGRGTERLGAGPGEPAAEVLPAASRAARGHADRAAVRRGNDRRVGLALERAFSVAARTAARLLSRLLKVAA